MDNLIDQEYYMKKALELAQVAYDNNEVPVGALVVHQDRVIGRGRNMIEELNDPLAHAEIIAIREAVINYGHKHLYDCSIFVTLEPCSMCAGAMVLARIKDLHYAASDLKTGAAGSVVQITSNKKFNHRLNIHSGILEKESSQLLKSFFKNVREKNA